MLLLSNKSLHLYIGARSVHGTSRARWSPGKVLVRSHHEFDHVSPDQSRAASVTPPIDEHCSRAIDAVLSELGASAAGQKLPLSVVMEDSRVHFDVVLGDYGDASDRHLQSIATACVAEVMGEDATSQIVRWQLQRDMRHLLISSINSQDITSVMQAAAQHGLQLRSLQPDFCVQWNQYAGATSQGSGVFVNISSNHAVAVCAQLGAISALSCGPYRDDGDALPSVVPHSTHLVDERVDRLLSCMGQDVAEISSFVLVTPDRERIATTSRWSVISPRAESV